MRWWRLARQYQIPDVDPISDRRLRDLLRAAISRTYPADDSRRVEQSLNGKVGGGTREMAGRRAEEIYASLHYRVETSEYRAILEDEDFGRWLAMKSRKVADNRSRV